MAFITIIPNTYNPPSLQFQTSPEGKIRSGPSSSHSSNTPIDITPIINIISIFIYTCTLLHN